MVLLTGLVVFNVLGGFLVSLGTATFPAAPLFAVVSVGVWILLKDQTLSSGSQIPLTQRTASSFQGWSAISKLEFSDEESGLVPERLTGGHYRYRVQFIAWPPTVGLCTAQDLEPFLSHLRKRQGEKVLVLTQLDPKVTIAEITALAAKHQVTLVSDLESRIKREALPDSTDFHRILVFGPAEKRVRWEIALHRIFEKNPFSPQKVDPEIQI